MKQRKVNLHNTAKASPHIDRTTAIEQVHRMLMDTVDQYIGVRFENNTNHAITTRSQRYLGVGAKTTLYFYGVQKEDIKDCLDAGATLLEIIEAEDGMPRLFDN